MERLLRAGRKSLFRIPWTSCSTWPPRSVMQAMCASMAIAVPTHTPLSLLAFSCELTAARHSRCARQIALHRRREADYQHQRCSCNFAPAQLRPSASHTAAFACVYDRSLTGKPSSSRAARPSGFLPPSLARSWPQASWQASPTVPTKASRARTCQTRLTRSAPGSQSLAASRPPMAS
jgi:hypothetical protein